MFLSIIVPTWRNTEAELIRCMDSIYQSTWLDFEVLLVDDGNEAAYGAMLDDLACCYPISVIHAPHGGVSVARNLAVKAAKGDFVLFVDADDVVTRQFWQDVEKVVKKGVSFDIMYGMCSDKKETPISYDICDGFRVRLLDEQERQKLYEHMFLMERGFCVSGGYLQRGPTARIIRRDFLLSFPFDTSLAIGEDIIWNMDMLLARPVCWVTENVWYYVIGNPNSATRGYNEKIVEQFRSLIRVLQRYVTANTTLDYYNFIFALLKDIGSGYFLSPKNSLPWFQKVKQFNEIVKSEPFNEILKIDARGIKPVLKCALYRAGLLLYVYKLKMLLGR